jgi:P-type Mg2+ transporter
MVGLAFALPYLPLVAYLGFIPLPSVVVASLALITALYVVAVEIAKLWFFRASARQRTQERRIKKMDTPSQGR